ncbi:unnamed protein product, partial [Callosobruchus maculatus]
FAEDTTLIAATREELVSLLNILDSTIIIIISVHPPKVPGGVLESTIIIEK